MSQRFQKTIYLKPDLLRQIQFLMWVGNYSSFQEFVVQAIAMRVDALFERFPHFKRFFEKEERKIEAEDEYGEVFEDNLKSELEWRIWNQEIGPPRRRKERTTGWISLKKPSR